VLQYRSMTLGNGIAIVCHLLNADVLLKRFFVRIVVVVQATRHQDQPVIEVNPMSLGEMLLGVRDRDIAGKNVKIPHLIHLAIVG
jgi:hypothetical protein